jgi:hypothetical protein
MKGIVFVELLAMAESIAGEEAVDRILDSVNLASGGAYSTVGNYPCAELMQLVQAFSQALDTPAKDLSRAFGKWMHGYFVRAYPGFFDGKADAFAMLEAIENEVHVEVRKLYPEAELPTFATERVEPGILTMTYRSPRPLIAFCHGLIEACLEHFGQRADVSVVDRSGEGLSCAVFEIRTAA